MRLLVYPFRLRPKLFALIHCRKKCALAFFVFYATVFIFIPHILENFDQCLKTISDVKSDLTSQILGDPFTETDAYIVNTYYYERSKNLGKNAVAMIILLNRNTMRNIRKYKMELVGYNGTSIVTSVPFLIEDSFAPCAYVNVVARTNLLSRMSRLEIRSNGVSFEIPFKQPRLSAPKPVIICLAPQFVAENWQIFVTHAHVSQRFGGHLHLYVTSIIDSYFHLVHEYERLGFVTLDYWVRMKFASSSRVMVEPNANTEWRNQAGAHTDCLYQYKEAADFIAFFDLDDIVFPRGYDSYYEEFSAFHFSFPDIRTFHYRKKEYPVVMQNSLSELDFRKIFTHSNYASEPAAAKIVARPENLDSLWIHESFNVPQKNKLYMNKNYITHLQKPKVEKQKDHLDYAVNEFSEQLDLALNRTILDEIQRDLEKTRTSSVIKKIATLLPSAYFYFPIVFKCYYDKYYNVPLSDQSAVCPNGEGCFLPQLPDLKCLHSDADYKSGPTMFPITFHYHSNTRWSDEIGCYQ